MVASLLTTTSAATGALAGFAAGGLLDMVVDVDRLEPRGLALAVALAFSTTLVLDAGIAPLSVRKQVPQLWGRIFSASTTAVLYGARLGVGPLTILRSWWWWTAFVLAALAGVWTAVLVGALFGAARVVAMLTAGTNAGGRQDAERWVRRAGPVLALVLTVVAMVGLPRTTTGEERTVDRPSAGGDAASLTDTPTTSEAPASSRTTTADLVPVDAEPDLVASLPDDAGPGFDRRRDDGFGLGPLDLDRAAAIEADPSAERSLLETRRFVAGHARAWEHDDGRLAYAAVYRFESAEGAAAYLVDGFLTLESRGARVYDVADPPGGRGFSQASENGPVSHGVAFVRSDRFFLTFVSATTSSAGPAEAAAFARRVAAMSG